MYIVQWNTIWGRIRFTRQIQISQLDFSGRIKFDLRKFRLTMTWSCLEMHRWFRVFLATSPDVRFSLHFSFRFLSAFFLSLLSFCLSPSSCCPVSTTNKRRRRRRRFTQDKRKCLAFSVAGLEAMQMSPSHSSAIETGRDAQRRIPTSGDKSVNWLS